MDRRVMSYLSGILNICNFFDPIISFLDQAFEPKFIREERRL